MILVVIQAPKVGAHRFVGCTSRAMPLVVDGLLWGMQGQKMETDDDSRAIR